MTRDDEYWLVSKEAARVVCEKEIEFLCEADLYEGMLIDSRTRFLLPVLYPLWGSYEWYESLNKLTIYPYWLNKPLPVVTSTRISLRVMLRFVRH